MENYILSKDFFVIENEKKELFQLPGDMFQQGRGSAVQFEDWFEKQWQKSCVFNRENLGLRKIYTKHCG